MVTSGTPAGRWPAAGRVCEPTGGEGDVRSPTGGQIGTKSGLPLAARQVAAVRLAMAPYGRVTGAYSSGFMPLAASICRMELTMVVLPTPDLHRFREGVGNPGADADHRRCLSVGIRAG